ncbi:MULTISPECIES: phage holin family protein [Sporomusa]|uniref:phage holin family protein n=1 Tax=Sporomusa TaxID=2375 RepID=UPI002B63FEC4|nr:phage holin family protein [Sporomusa sphaeroides]HML33912.1 phage holin family protein [Sporomusa sphaeroides]
MLEKTWQMFKRGSENLLDLWPVKAIMSGLSALWCYLFGGSEAIIFAALVFVALDTITKWAAITKRWLLDHGTTEADITFTGYICGFWYAWAPGYLSSRELRQKWGEKLFTYLVLIIAAGVVDKLPEINLFGLPVNRSITGGIYTCILLTELFSLAENFEEMGSKRMAQFKQLLCTISNKATGGNFSVTFRKGDKHIINNVWINQFIISVNYFF